jgi:hypothetical protein
MKKNKKKNKKKKWKSSLNLNKMQGSIKEMIKKVKKVKKMNVFLILFKLNQKFNMVATSTSESNKNWISF